MVTSIAKKNNYQFNKGVRSVEFAPPKKLVRMRYCSYVAINPVAGQMTSYVFRANSVYDPDLTGVGHQPSYYDQCAALYDHYHVKESHLKATFFNNIAAANYAVVVAAKVDDDGTISTDMTSLLEDDDVVYQVLRLSATEETKSLTIDFNSDSFFGKEVSDETAPFGQNPEEVAYFNLAVGAADQSSDPATVSAVVVIDYIVECSERKDLIASNRAVTRTQHPTPRGQQAPPRPNGGPRA